MRKGIKLAIVTMALIAILNVPAFAGEWKQDATGWWYQNADGTYPKSKWEWLDGNQDGVAECYYFNDTGYLLTNATTPDNCQVNENGAWMANGRVQTKAVVADNGGGTTETSENLQYTVKRLSRVQDWKVDGGQIVTCYDVTNIDQRDPKEEYRYRETKNFKADMELFVPDNMDWPLALVQVELDGETIISITPVWIDSLNYNYGNFGDPEIRGRLEWREYEQSDPEYALELKRELNEEAKQRAFAKYPNMIVDYSD